MNQLKKFQNKNKNSSKKEIPKSVLVDKKEGSSRERLIKILDRIEKKTGEHVYEREMMLYNLKIISQFLEKMDKDRKAFGSLDSEDKLITAMLYCLNPFRKPVVDSMKMKAYISFGEAHGLKEKMDANLQSTWGVLVLPKDALEYGEDLLSMTTNEVRYGVLNFSKAKDKAFMKEKVENYIDNLNTRYIDLFSHQLIFRKFVHLLPLEFHIDKDDPDQTFEGSKIVKLVPICDLMFHRVGASHVEDFLSEYTDSVITTFTQGGARKTIGEVLKTKDMSKMLNPMNHPPIPEDLREQIKKAEEILSKRSNYQSLSPFSKLYIYGKNYAYLTYKLSEESNRLRLEKINHDGWVNCYSMFEIVEVARENKVKAIGIVRAINLDTNEDVIVEKDLEDEEFNSDTKFEDFCSIGKQIVIAGSVNLYRKEVEYLKMEKIPEIYWLNMYIQWSALNESNSQSMNLLKSNGYFTYLDGPFQLRDIQKFWNFVEKAKELLTEEGGKNPTVLYTHWYTKPLSYGDAIQESGRFDDEMEKENLSYPMRENSEFLSMIGRVKSAMRAPLLGKIMFTSKKFNGTQKPSFLMDGEPNVEGTFQIEDRAIISVTDFCSMEIVKPTNCPSAKASDKFINHPGLPITSKMYLMASDRSRMKYFKKVSSAATGTWNVLVNQKKEFQKKKGIYMDHMQYTNIGMTAKEITNYQVASHSGMMVGYQASKVVIPNTAMWDGSVEYMDITELFQKIRGIVFVSSLKIEDAYRLLKPEQKASGAFYVYKNSEEKRMINPRNLFSPLEFIPWRVLKTSYQSGVKGEYVTDGRIIHEVEGKYSTIEVNGETYNVYTVEDEDGESHTFLVIWTKHINTIYNLHHTQFQNAFVLAGWEGEKMVPGMNPLDGVIHTKLMKEMDGKFIEVKTSVSLYTAVQSAMDSRYCGREKVCATASGLAMSRKMKRLMEETKVKELVDFERGMKPTDIIKLKMKESSISLLTLLCHINGCMTWERESNEQLRKFSKSMLKFNINAGSNLGPIKDLYQEERERILNEMKAKKLVINEEGEVLERLLNDNGLDREEDGELFEDFDIKEELKKVNLEEENEFKWDDSWSNIENNYSEELQAMNENLEAFSKRMKVEMNVLLKKKLKLVEEQVTQEFHDDIRELADSIITFHERDPGTLEMIFEEFNYKFTPKTFEMCKLVKEADEEFIDYIQSLINEE